MEFSSQEYWSGWPFPSPGDLPNPWIKPCLLHCRQIYKHCRQIHKHMCIYVCVLSCFCCVWLCETLWIAPFQDPLSMIFPRQEYWSGLPWPPLGDLPDPGIKRMSLNVYLHWQAGSLPLVAPGKPMCVCVCVCIYIYIYIYKKLTPFAIYLKLTQYCKWTKCQSKKWFKKNPSKKKNYSVIMESTARRTKWIKCLIDYFSECFTERFHKKRVSWSN